MRIRLSSPTASARGGCITFATLLLAVITLLSLVSTKASAAVLSGTLSTSPPAPEDLTADGSRDWAIWNYTGGNSGSQIAPPTNRKANVTSVISDATTLVGNARGSTASPATMTYSYSDGVNPVTLTSSTQGELFDSTLNNTGSGFTFTITSGAAGVPEAVKLFLTGFGSTPTLTVSLPGATDYTNSDVTYPVNTRPPTVYTINFTPDHDGDLLTVRYQATTNNSTNANIDLQAVTVAVPEPASIGIIALGMAALAASRRRRSR
jgi:hypothetical protein